MGVTGCPGLRILATSREALGLAGETVWRVPSLKVPESPNDLEQVAHSEAGRLFVERARAIMPTFELDAQNVRAVAEVCRRLDGVPLALELAAARVSLLSVDQVASRLDDALGLLVASRRLAPARQQSVRATLDWSYALLTDPERVLFERLSVFAGGWTLEAAEAVAGTDGIAAREVLGLLGRLADTSMVVVEPGPAADMRYRLLEPLRQYAGERLSERGSADAIRRHHSAYFLALAEHTEPEASSSRAMASAADWGAWATRLEAEHDNLRAALGWLLEQADADGAQRLAGALGRFWFFRGHLAEGEMSINRALALASGHQPTAGRTWCLRGLRLLALRRGDYVAVERLAQETCTLFQALGNAAQEASSLFHLGLATTQLGKYRDARASLEAGLAVSRAAGHGAIEASCLIALAELAANLGEDEHARGWATAALGRATDIGQVRQIALARRVLGLLSMRNGEYAGAAQLLEMSLATWRELGFEFGGVRGWRGTGETLVRFGQLAIEQADPSTARTWLSESMTIAQELGDPAATAEVLEGFVQIAVIEGRPRLALQLAGAAESLRESTRVPLPPAERSRLEPYVASARSALGEPAAEMARADGCSLGTRKAIELALMGPVHSVDRGTQRGATPVGEARC